jgi:nucleoside-diphosphate-sugar epimerase
MLARPLRPLECLTLASSNLRAPSLVQHVQPASGRLPSLVRRVLVTGADGFIVSQIARGLRAAGYDVTGVVFARPAGLREVRVDLTRAGELRRLPRGTQAIVHAAGVVDAQAPSRLIFEVNVRGTANLLAWARARDVSHFVQLSSVAVYGPLVVGAERGEDTPRLATAIGLPYMRSKARAERAVEDSGVPFTLLRPPAVVGPGDTVITRGFVDALRGAGLPLLPRAHAGRRVALAFAPGLADLSALVLARGALGRAVHAVDAELTLLELAQLYAAALRLPLRFGAVGWTTAVGRRRDAGFSWLVASALAGQHYSATRLHSELGYLPRHTARAMIEAAVGALA